MSTKIALVFCSILELSFWFQNRVQNRLSLAPVAHTIVACVANVVVVPKKMIVERRMNDRFSAIACNGRPASS